MAKEKKGAKFGRHRDRSPSAKAYKAENRAARNKRLRMSKAAIQRERDANKAKRMKTLRGTARKLRRAK